LILFSERDAEYSVGKHLPSSTRKVVKQLTGVGNESDLQKTDLNVELVELNGKNVTSTASEVSSKMLSMIKNESIYVEL
jgi:hypothetical protein